VRRTCVLYKTSTIYPRYVCFDSEIAVALLKYIGDPKKKKKLDYIVNRILFQDFVYYDDYVKLTAYDGLSEMRLFPNGDNTRIYCKEVSTKDGKFYVIAAKFLEKKKSEKIDKSINQMIKPIEKYEYELTGLAGQNSGAPGEQN
jgi:hypothetical protein